MDDYLSKPVQLEDLRSVIEKYLSINQSATEIEAQQVGITKPIVLTAEGEAESVPVNVHILEELIGNDAATIKEMLQDFRISAEKITSELQAAYRAKQFALVGSIAHKLKSSARSVGALALGELCAKIEQAGKQNNEEALLALLPRFDTEIITVNAYLDTLYGKED